MSMSVPGQKTVTEIASKHAPWRRGVKWWVLLIQGVVLFVLGLYIITLAVNAANITIFLVSLYLLVNGILRVAHTSRSESPKRAHQLALLHGIVAIVVSAIVIIIMLTTDTTTSEGLQLPATLLGIGILVIGVLSVLSAFLFREGAPIDRGALVSGAILLIFGVLIFLMLNGTIPFQLIGWVALVTGIILVVVAYGRYQSVKTAAAAASAESTAAAAAPAPAAPAPAAPAPVEPAAAAPAAPAAAAPVEPPPAPAPAAPATPEPPPPAPASDVPPPSGDATTE